MLSLICKTPVKILWDDGVSETSVVLSSSDDQEALVSKLRRVLELAGATAPQRAAIAAYMPADPADLVAERRATEARLKAAPVNGWAAEDGPDIDDLPEM